MELAKNKTTLTKKMLIGFQNREIFKRSWVIALCALALIVVSFKIVDGQIVLASIPFLVIGCVAYPLYIGILELIFYKQNKSFSPVTIEYTFTEKTVKLYGTSSLGEETTELPYSNLEKIVFTKKYIYLYINKTSALLVDNGCFESGSVEKIRSLLEYSFPQKVKGFKPKKKKEEIVKEEKINDEPEKIIDEPKIQTEDSVESDQN